MLYNFGLNFNMFFNPFMNFFMPFNAYNPFMNYTPSIFQNNYSRFSPEPFNPKPFDASSIFASASKRTYSTNNDTYVKGVKFNKYKGESLAKKIVDILPSNRDPENPLCAKYVKNAIAQCGLGRYELGNADACTDILRRNPNFREVKLSEKEQALAPRGTVIVYDAFDTVSDKNGKSGKIGKDGHIIVSLGKGKACSDIMEDEIFQSDRAHVFIPV